MKKLIKDLTEEKIKELEAAGLSLDQILDSYEGTEEEEKTIKDRKQEELDRKQEELNEHQKNLEKYKPFSDEDHKQIERIKVSTTFQINNMEIDYVIDVITGESLGGLSIMRAALARTKEIAGGIGDADRKTLRELRKACIFELKAEAYRLDADAVIGVDLDYFEYRGERDEKLLFLVASGTAVKLK